MQFRDDRRGQAIQIGAVLLLGAVVLSLSIYQASVVPEQNREIEFKHSQQVQDQLGDARNAIVSTGSTGDSRSMSIRMGTQYPSRIIAMNPSPPSGSLSTVGTTDGSVNVTVANATATGETGHFWNGTERSYNTGAIVYRPGYNEYTGAPTTWYENSVLFDEFRDANLTVTDQRLVDGDRISLVTLNGSYYTSRSGSASLDFRAVSTSTRTVSVTNATASSNVTISVPTRLNASDWEALLAEEIDSGHVGSVTTTDVTGEDYRMLHVTLDRLDKDGQQMTYGLDIARVGVGTQVVRPDAAYLTDVAGNGSTVPENGETQFTVEIRDALNNPKKDVRVVAGTQWDNSSVSPESATTDSDGQVTLTYDAPEDIDGVTQGTDYVQVSLNTSLSDAVNGTAINASTAENVSMVVRVDNSDGSGLSDGSYGVNWDHTAIESQSGITGCFASNNTCVYNISEDSNNKFDATMNTTPATVGAFVDFTWNNSIVSLNPSETNTDELGEAETTVSVSATGTTELMVSTTVDNDQVNLKVVGSESSGPPAASQTLQAVESEGVDGGNTLIFDIENTGSTSVTAVNFSVEDIGPGLTKIDNNDNDELKIGGTAAANRTGNGNMGEFKANGDAYEFTEEGGTNVDIASGNQVTVDIRGFDTDFGSVEYADSAADADIIVTIGLIDGSVQEFYFREV